MRRARTSTVTVEIDLDEVDERDLLAEVKERGLIGLHCDLGRLRATLGRRDYRSALRTLEQALPSEFAGFADEIADRLSLAPA